MYCPIIDAAGAIGGAAFPKGQENLEISNFLIFMMTIDTKKDKRLADEWESSNSKGGMTADEITFLASTGLQTCKDFCASRKYTGENRCICIRERFPTSAHYDLYLRARSKYLELLEIGILAKAASQEATGEKNET